MDQPISGRAAVLVVLLDIDEITFVIQAPGFVVARHGLRNGGRDSHLDTLQYFRSLVITPVRDGLDVLNRERFA